MADVSKRKRQAKGKPTAGEFAAEEKGEQTRSMAPAASPPETVREIALAIGEIQNSMPEMYYDIDPNEEVVRVYNDDGESMSMRQLYVSPEFEDEELVGYHLREAVSLPGWDDDYYGFCEPHELSDRVTYFCEAFRTEHEDICLDDDYAIFNGDYHLRTNPVWAADELIKDNPYVRDGVYTGDVSEVLSEIGNTKVGVGTDGEPFMTRPVKGDVCIAVDNGVAYEAKPDSSEARELVREGVDRFRDLSGYHRSDIPLDEVVDKLQVKYDGEVFLKTGVDVIEEACAEVKGDND